MEELPYRSIGFLLLCTNERSLRKRHYARRPPAVHYLVGGRPEVLELSRLRAVLTAADKYDLAVLEDTLQNNLRLHIPAEPLRVYAVAYMREDAELAHAAARCLLAHPQFSVPADPPPEYHEIPAIAIWQVHMYRQRCVLAALEIFRSEEHIISPPRAGHAISVSRKGNADTSGAWVWLACTSCDAGWLSLAVSNSATGRRDTVRPRAWWQKYFDAVLLRETVAEAAKCTTCGPRGALQVYEYAEAMAGRIDEATSKISIELPFQTHPTSEATTDPDVLPEPELSLGDRDGMTTLEVHRGLKALDDSSKRKVASVHRANNRRRRHHVTTERYSVKNTNDAVANSQHAQAIEVASTHYATSAATACCRMYLMPYMSVKIQEVGKSSQ
ncbi:hypothetical protein VTO73DRAFT_5065 [Trametes versicolor]